MRSPRRLLRAISFAPVRRTGCGDPGERLPVRAAEDDPGRATQQQEVREPSLAAVGPVLQVMGVDEAAPVAARELAAPVAAAQGTPQRRRDGPGLATDRQGPPLALHDRHQVGVAGQSAGRLRQRRPVLELAAAVWGAVREGGGVDVHDELQTLGSGAGARA